MNRVQTYTPTQAREALRVFDALFSHGLLNGRDPRVARMVDRRKKGKKDPKPNAPAIVEMEAQLRADLVDAWVREGSVATDEVLSALVNGTGDVTAVEAAALLSALEQKMGPGVAAETMASLKDILPQVYDYGRATFVEKPVFGLIDTQARDWTIHDTNYWVGEHYGADVGPRISGIIQSEVIEKGLGRGEAARLLEETLGAEFSDKSAAYWEVVSASGVTRARNFGAVGSFVEGGFEEIEAVAMMDEATSPICLYLNGKVWKTKWAVDQRDAMLASKTPVAARAASPWLRFEEINGKTTEALQALGVVLAPYHGRCRTVNVVH